MWIHNHSSKCRRNDLDIVAGSETFIKQNIHTCLLYLRLSKGNCALTWIPGPERRLSDRRIWKLTTINLIGSAWRRASVSSQTPIKNEAYNKLATDVFVFLLPHLRSSLSFPPSVYFFLFSSHSFSSTFFAETLRLRRFLRKAGTRNTQGSLNPQPFLEGKPRSHRHA